MAVINPELLCNNLNIMEDNVAVVIITLPRDENGNYFSYYPKGAEKYRISRKSVQKITNSSSSYNLKQLNFNTFK